MKKILVSTSARHVHLKKEDLEILFGKGYELTNKKDLIQPGQFACEERVTLKGPKSDIKNVSILGPLRKDTQVEVSLTDARSLGVNAAIRESGNIDGTEGITIIGPKGEITLSKGVIAAKRHIHLTPDTAKEYGLNDKQVVNVKIETDERSIIFGDVVVRVREDFAPEMHIDTDESNSAGIKGGVEGEVQL